MEASIEDGKGCRIWNGTKLHHTGYGLISLNGKKTQVHRLAYEAWTQRPIPKGAFITHDCDNKPCVNPFHLRLGDAKSNSREAWDRGRQKSLKGMAKPRMPDRMVREMRKIYHSGHSKACRSFAILGRSFGVTRMTASNICQYKTRRSA